MIVYYDNYVNLWDLNQDLQGAVMQFVSKKKVNVNYIIQVDIQELSITVYKEEV